MKVQLSTLAPAKVETELPFEYIKGTYILYQAAWGTDVRVFQDSGCWYTGDVRVFTEVPSRIVGADLVPALPK